MSAAEFSALSLATSKNNLMTGKLSFPTTAVPTTAFRKSNVLPSRNLAFISCATLTRVNLLQSTPISELGKLVSYTTEGYEIVIGSRGSRRPDSSFLRQLASIVFLLARRAILLPEIHDTQCGFKLLDTKLARQIFSRMRIFGRTNNAIGWKVTAYDVEMLHLAKKMGKPIKEVSVRWKNEDTSSGKSRNFVKESLEMFAEILRVRVNDLLGKYDR